jgi:diadenylate cyclase
MTFFIWNKITPTVEILILWFVFYRILVFFEGTRAFQVLRGLMYLLIAFLVSKLLGLDTINWLLTKIFGLSIIALMIIFHQELRQGLARLGQQHLFSITLGESEIIALIEELSNAIFKLSKQNIGALLAIERVTKLNTYIESGVLFDSRISSEIIQSIFNPHSPLHDGGIIIRDDRIVAAACLFPLTDNPSISKIVGTRHRAALGISEQTDSVALLVSEETGEVCIAADGKFTNVKNSEELVNTLKNFLVAGQNKKKKK